jgi:hypothetical protein
VRPNSFFEARTGLYEFSKLYRFTKLMIFFREMADLINKPLESSSHSQQFSQVYAIPQKPEIGQQYQLGQPPPPAVILPGVCYPCVGAPVQVYSKASHHPQMLSVALQPQIPSSYWDTPEQG